MVPLPATNDSSRLRFSVLGPVRAWRGTTEVDIGPHLQRALLSVLLLKEGGRVSVGELVDALWGDDAPTTAESGIRTYVYRLRRALDLPGSRRPSVIESSGHGYSMPLDRVSLDLMDFREHVEQAQLHRLAEDHAQARERLRAALALWNGDTALSNIPGAFAEGRRARLAEERLSAIEDLLLLSEDDGLASVQLSKMFSLVRDNPLRERLWESLISALYRAGRRAEALLAFEECRRTLANELGVGPGASLRNLHERVLRSDPELLRAPHTAAGRMRTAPRRTAPLTDLAPAQLPSDLQVFAGRTEELARLHAMLPAEDQRPTSVSVGLITGMPGVGKSALAVHWAHQVADRFPDGQVYLDLQGYDASGSPMPVDEAMRLVLQSLGDDIRDLPRDRLALLARYRTLLSRVRFLLVLDNARTDELTRPLVAGAPGSCVLVTSRADLSSLAAIIGATTVKLDVLSPRESHEFVRRRLDSTRLSLAPDVVDDIVELCEGLPLAMALMVAQAAGNPGAPAADLVEDLRAARNSPVSSSASRLFRNLGRVVSWSWSGLSPGAAALLAALSRNFAREFDLPSAAALAGIPRRTAAGLLVELADANLITEVERGVYRCHTLVQVYGREADRGARCAT